MNTKRFMGSAGVAALLAAVFLIAAALLADSSPKTTEIGHTVEGDVLADLVLDPAEFGTETIAERGAIEACYREATGASAPDEIVNPTFEELYAWRECAVELGIESKVLKFEPVSDDERAELVEAANADLVKFAACLAERDWTVELTPPDAAGNVGLEVVDERTAENRTMLEADLEECGILDVSVGHDHDHDHDHED